MTVAEFFREARASTAQAGDSAAFASGVVADFLSHYKLEDCAPQHLLTLAELAARGGETDVARTALDRVVQSGETVHLAHYRRGRLEMAQEDPVSAFHHFQSGAHADPNFPFNWMGAARALHAQGLKESALPHAERFLSFGVRPHGANELAILADLGDHLFDAGDRKRSLKLYEFVARFGAETPRDAVRLAEAMIVAGDPAGAQRVLVAQQERGRLDPWGRRALALASSYLGEHDRALEHAEAVLQHDPGNAGFAGTYLDVLVRAGSPERFRDALARFAPVLTADAVRELTARLKVADGDVEGAAADLDGAQISYQARLYYLMFETAYKALGAGLHDVAMALGERLGALAPDDSFVKLLRIDIFFRQQMWEQAASLLAGMNAAESQAPHVVLKQFEYACFINDHAGAAALCARLDEMALPDKQFMLPVFRYFAERKAWNQVVDRALPWLDAQFNYDQIGYVLFRAAKHTGRQAQVISAVEAVPDWQMRADLVRLRANLACDRAETLPAIDKLARDPTIADDALMLKRLEVKRDVLARAMAQGKRRAIFLCTDRNYLCATIVALHSAIAAMAAIDPLSADFFVVVDDGMAELCRQAVAPFTEDGLAVTVVPASDIVESAEKLQPDYGLFTSGHVLASAAYYRIYFARYLQRLGGYERAIYLDSDIIVRGSLQPLFRADLQGKPMAARLDSMRPEVRRAISLHKLTDNRYFNSGVILFDLKNKRLAAGLDGAVGAIVDDDVTLLFHDQCALNLGFRSDFADMDRLFNYPVNESTRLADVPEEAVILHFLDRPKPWSAAYGGDAGALWFERWRETAAVIGEATAMELFAQVQE
jgi:lipopolysaccharide biosynthesis glycosyltransferase/predicted Zn-dependent protease